MEQPSHKYEKSTRERTEIISSLNVQIIKWNGADLIAGNFSGSHTEIPCN